MSSDEEIIAMLQQDESRGTTLVYEKCYPYFIGLARREVQRAQLEDAEDAFQETIMVFILKFIRTGRIRVENGQLIGLWVPLRKFIAKIGLRILVRALTKPGLPPPPPADAPESEVLVERALKAFGQLKHPCQRLVFYKVALNLEANEIASILQMETREETPIKEGTIRTRLYRCMEKLRNFYR
jgi:DNA-directed RNA polymerase specialized sigma24 family protein